MNYSLTVSSQGQIIIPIAVRNRVGIKPGSKILLTVKDTSTGPVLKLKPNPKSLVMSLAGSAKGMFGDVDKYIENERNSWDR